MRGCGVHSFHGLKRSDQVVPNALELCHLVGEVLDEDRASQEEFCSRRRPVAELWNIRPGRGSTGEGDSPSRSSTSQAIFQHRVAGGRGCQGEACQ